MTTDIKFVSLEKTDPPKKWKVSLRTPDNKIKIIRFGASGYFDYTSHTKEQREQRKINYLNRHKTREDWNKSGIFTAGFWSRWILWNKTTIKASLDDVKRRFF